MKTYLYHPTMREPKEGDLDLLGSPCMHNNTH